MLLIVEEVRAYMQSGAASLDDEPLDILIGAATKEFARFTEREFEPSEGEQERTFMHWGGLTLDLAPFDVRSVSSVTTGADLATPTVATGYRLRPLPSVDGTYQRIRLAADPGPCEVTVKGEWGFAEVPDDIKHLALATVMIWAKRELEVYERTYNVDSSFFERPRELPSAVEAGLGNFKRKVIA